MLALVFQPLTTHLFRDGAPLLLLTEAPATLWAVNTYLPYRRGGGHAHTASFPKHLVLNGGRHTHGNRRGRGRGGNTSFLWHPAESVSCFGRMEQTDSKDIIGIMITIIIKYNRHQHYHVISPPSSCDITITIGKSSTYIFRGFSLE